MEGTYQDSQARKDFKSIKSAQDVLDVLTRFIRNGNTKVSSLTLDTFFSFAHGLNMILESVFEETEGDRFPL